MCAVSPGCAAGTGPVGRGVALPHAVPLPSLGRQQSGRHWRCAVHGGRGPRYHSGSCSPGFSGYDLCGVPVRRRGLARSSRPPWEPAAGAGGRVALRLPSRAGGDHPPCLGRWGPGPRGWRVGGGAGGGGVAPRPPCSPSGRRPAVLHPGPLRIAGTFPSGVRVRSGLKCRPGVRGGEGRPVDRSPGGPSRPEPPLFHPGVGCGYGRVMWGAASFLFRCARCSGTPVWVRGSRSIRRCPYRVAIPSGGGAPPRPWGGGGPRCGSPAGVGAGGGGVGGPPPRPLSPDRYWGGGRGWAPELRGPGPWWLSAGAGGTRRASGLQLVRGGAEGPGWLGGQPREAPRSWARTPEGGRSLRGGGVLPARGTTAAPLQRGVGAGVYRPVQGHVHSWPRGMGLYPQTSAPESLFRAG